MECSKNAEKKEEHHRAGMSDECNASIFFLWEGRQEEEKQDTQTQADTEKEEPKEKEGQGNLNIISPQAYSNVEVVTLEPEHTFP